MADTQAEDKGKAPQGKGKQQKKEKKKTPKFDPSQFPEPAYFAERIAVWDEVKSKQPPIEKKPITITLKDGKKMEGVAGETTPQMIAKQLSQALGKKSVVATVNEKNWDVGRVLEEDCELELHTFESEKGRETFWHSSAHILGQAMERSFGATLCIGPATKQGFYYDCVLPEQRPVKEEDLETIQNFAKTVVSEKQPFERLVLSKEEALRMFAYNKYKVQIISEKVPDGDTITAYRCGPLIDLCRGPHLPTTGYVPAFKVLKNSSAYWLGNADNDALQRVYGVAFASNKELAAHEEMLKQAALRDHRKIGKEQELFMFHEWSAGCAFFLPHGARIYNKLMDLLKSEYRNRGYSEVMSPNLFNAALWEQSGHWQHYKDDMFTFAVDKQQYGLKPMNCPAHCLMFGYRTRSHRELPLRYADFGVLHRNELHGALTGLTRVRRFQQDDCHVFCTKNQIRQELFNEIAFMEHIYGIFGYKFTLELSTRPENYLGDLEVWNMAEDTLQKVLEEKFPGAWNLNPGDGAFYGPKIDIHITDAIGRSHQCATVQLDFTLPERFDLNFSNDQNELERPIIIHRAMYGSLERFIAILIEHTAGKWPFWLSPRQIKVVPIAQQHLEYAQEVKEIFHKEGYYVDVDTSDHTIKRKIREAREAQYNYMLVVGGQEVENRTVAIRERLAEKPLGVFSLDDAKALFKGHVDKFE
jgi:threonyl-tRNA synthetase